MYSADESTEESSEDETPGHSGQDFSGQKQRRRAITDEQRKILRVHKEMLVQENGKWTHQEMINFFERKYDRVLHKSTISESLSNSFRHLDDGTYPVHPESMRRRDSKWPDLEDALFDWQHRISKQQRKLTNNDIKRMARKLFDKLPQYHNVESPRFSKHWLENYKARYNIGGSGGVKQMPEESSFEDIRQKLKFSELEDIYNVDESALFWKMSPDTTLAAGDGKLEKAQITVILACNVTGTRKLAPWIIGKAQTPRCFDRSGVHVRNLPIVWRYNGKASIRGKVFAEYIRWFMEQMAGRKVCLIMDNLSAHLSGIAYLSLEFPKGFPNTEIILLPPNTASESQPLHHGIIRSLKAHYRKRWLEYMCGEYDKDRNPMKSMNVLRAVRWVIAAWEDNVTPTTIHNSWVKSRILGPNYSPQIEGWNEDVDEDDQIFKKTIIGMQRRIQSLAREKYIKSVMEMATFILPKNEIVDDSNEDIFDSIAESSVTGVVERDHETDEEDEPETLIEHSEALTLLARLHLYEEQQEDCDEMVLSRLKEYEKTVRARLPS